MRQKVFLNEISLMTLYVYVCILVANFGCAVLSRRRRTLLLYHSPLPDFVRNSIMLILLAALILDCMPSVFLHLKTAPKLENK